MMFSALYRHGNWQEAIDVLRSFSVDRTQDSTVESTGNWAQKESYPMSFVPVPSWIVPGCVFVVLGLSVTPPVLAQGGPPVINLGANRAIVEGDWLAYSQWESFQGEDLNGDGDTDDSALRVRRLSTGETTTLRQAGSVVALSGDWLVLSVYEGEQGEDLNGDGDTEDPVVHVHHLAAAETTNLRLAGLHGPISQDWTVFSVYEPWQGEDLNGDGDTRDFVVHVRRLSTGESTNLRLAGYPQSLSGDWLVFSVYEGEQGEDLNGDGDTRDSVVHLVDLTPLGALAVFLRGDCNDDGTVDISDAIFSLGSLFLGDGNPDCVDACDSNDDGAVDISDAIATLGVLFLGNGIIPPPGMTGCGGDPTGDALDCERVSECG